MTYSRIIAALSVVASVFVMGCGGSKASPAKTPDAVVMQVTKAVNNNQPQKVFQALPDSYQADINSVISDAAKKMDAEVWSESHKLIEQILKIAKEKKDLILGTSMLANTPDKAALSKSWDQNIEMLETVISSDFADLEKLRKCDAAKLLADNGAAIMAKAKSASVGNPSYKKMQKTLDKLKSVKASIESKEGDVTNVKIETEGETPEIVSFVKVEGKWIPKDLADTFATKIAEARTNIVKMDFSSEKGKAAKAKIMQQISMIKTMLTQAEAAKTSQAMEGVMMGLMMGAMSMGGGATGGAGTPPPPPPPSM